MPAGSVRTMVRVKLIVRVIPENVYLQGVKSTASRLVTEKRLLQIVDEPEHVLIGSLANEIKDTFQRINHELVISSAVPYCLTY